MGISAGFVQSAMAFEEGNRIEGQIKVKFKKASKKS